MLEKIKTMLAEQFNLDPDTLSAETSFRDDLGADSLDLFELVMAVEEEYSIEIPAEELADVKTIGDVVEFLKEKGINF